MPHTCGEENKIHIDEIDFLVPCSYDLPEIPRPKITDIEKNIGKYCASLVKDGDTLQFGIGAIPDAVAMFLKDKKHLGIHTEMFSDSVIDLIELGVIDNSQKKINNGKIVSAFVMGTKRLYDYIDNNPQIELFPIEYVNNPQIIGKNDNVVSINSCIEVDLMGQVNSETIGSRQFSGTGGQVDYVRGAAISQGGISIIAMPSTTADERISKIVPFLAEGIAVTTSRKDVDYIITEYGIAPLKYKTLRERAENLIKIAPPKFRDELQKEFQKRLSINDTI